MNKAKIEELKFTKEDFNQIKDFLPINYVAVVTEKIGNKISKRQVRNIINGEQKDEYMVIDALLNLVAERKSALALQKERIKALSSK